MKITSYLLLVLLITLSGCADHVIVSTAREAVGFWHGLWHGFILPISWIISLFDSDTAIYAVYNNGGWYDFGFVLGVGAFASGGR